MKKQYVSLLTIILSIGSLLYSCVDKVNKNVGALEFDSIQVNNTSYLFGDTAKPGCNLVINFTYAIHSSDEQLKDSLNNYLISICFDNKYVGETPERVMKEYTDTYVNEYRHDLEPMYLEDEKNKKNGESVEAWYSYYKTIEGHVQMYEQNLLVYQVYFNEYTGGAHGMYTSTYYNIDLNLMRPLRLEDIFTGDYKDALTDLIWNQLMAENDVTTHEALEDLGYGSTGEIAPTENFYLDKEGITFYYNLYDITPYSMGPVAVTIPFSMMEHLLSNNPIIRQLQN